MSHRALPWLLASASFLWLQTPAVRSQAKIVDERKPAAIEQLLNHCLKEGALRLVRDPKTGRPVEDPALRAPEIAIADRTRLTAVFAKHRVLLTKEVGHFLAGAAKLARKEAAPPWVYLLAAFGQETKDDTAIELAAHAAWRLNMPHASDEGLAALKELTKAGAEGSVLGLQKDARTGKYRLLTADRKKLAQFAADKRAAFSPDLLDTLIAMTLRGVDHTVLIRAAADTLDDPRLRAFAAYFEARALRQDGKLDDAGKRFAEAAQSFDKLRDTPWKAMALSQEAEVALELAESARAVTAYREAVRIFRVVHAGKHKDFARLLTRLADAYLEQGEYAQALAAYVEAMPSYLADQGLKDEDFIEGAAVFQQLARIHARTGFDNESLKWHRNALEILNEVAEPDHPLIALGLSELGHLYLRQGEVAKAGKLFERVLTMRIRKRGPDHPDTADSLRNMALVHIRLGNLNAALTNLDRAAGIYRERHGVRHLSHVATQRELAQLHILRKRDDLALQTVNRGLLNLAAIDEKRPISKLRSEDFRPGREAIELLRLRGDILLGTAKTEPKRDDRHVFLQAALGAYRTAAGVLEHLREVIPAEADRVQLSAEVAAIFPRQLITLHQLHDLDPKQEHLEAAFAVAEEGTARAFLQTLGASVARIKVGVPAKLLAEEEKSLVRLRALDREMVVLSGKDPEGSVKLMEQRRSVVREYYHVKEQINDQFPSLASLRSARPCTSAEAAACLGKNEVAVLFILDEEHSFAIVLQATGRLSLVPLPKASEIADAVAPLTDLETLRLPARTRQLARTAHDLILGPLEKEIRGKDLVVVPSGALCLVPLEMLASKEGYLLEHRRVRYVPSLTVLHLVKQRERKRLPTPQLFLAVGDPVYEQSDPRIKGKIKTTPAAPVLSEDVSKMVDTTFPRLVHSGAEVETLARVLGHDNGTVRLGLDATETQIKDASSRGELARAKYLHFAVHGLPGTAGVRQPALVLTLHKRSASQKKDEPGDDGFLELDEVMNLRLNADLVVLSACKSGRGPQYQGEGVTGLARAFLHAGSKGVVCSLWSVDDRETSNLMVDFYGHLQKGKSAPDALREAQLSMIRAGKAPLYWAPFIVIGE